MKNNASLQTPLAKVRGLGAAKEGVRHWWAQRLSALALLPLTLWFVYHAVILSAGDYRDAALWAGRPVNTVLLALLVIATFQHMALGLQVVIEDYVHCEGRKLAFILAVKTACILLAAAALFAIAKLAIKGYP